MYVDLPSVRQCIIYCVMLPMSDQKVVNVEIVCKVTQCDSLEFFCSAEILYLRNGALMCPLAQ